MSDFREMLFSKTIEPKNWQELQAKDEAMQEEIDHLRKMDEQADVVDRLHDEMKESGMDLSDFIDSGSTY